MTEVVDPPHFEGRLSADGTFVSCEGCNLTVPVDFQTDGISNPMVRIGVAFNGLFTLLYFVLWAVAYYKVKRVFLVDTKAGGMSLELPRALGLASIGGVLYVVAIGVAEATPTIKGSFLILYGVYAFINLFMEVVVASAFMFFLQIRFFALHGREYVEEKYVRQNHVLPIARYTRTILVLVALARTGIVIYLVVKLLHPSPGRFQRDDFLDTLLTKADHPGIANGLSILAKIATAAKSVYLALSILYILTSIKLYRDYRREGVKSTIPRHLIIASLFYFIWALATMAVFISSTYTHTMIPRGGYLIHAFTYEFPNLLALLYLVVAGTRPDWPYNEWSYWPIGWSW